MVLLYGLMIVQHLIWLVVKPVEPVEPSEKWWSELVTWNYFPFPTEWKVIIHSMGPVTTNQSMIQVHAVLFVQIRYVIITLWWTNIAIENGHL